MAGFNLPDVVGQLYNTGQKVYRKEDKREIAFSTVEFDLRRVSFLLFVFKLGFSFPY